MLLVITYCKKVYHYALTKGSALVQLLSTFYEVVGSAWDEVGVECTAKSGRVKANGRARRKMGSSSLPPYL